MAELQRNFLQGIMNKDLDPHFLPDGQYRDALNIIVSDSDATFSTTDGQHNGSAQNYLGNTLMNSSLGLSSSALCIGALSNPAKNTIYWMIASDEFDAVVEYNEEFDTTSFILKATKDTPTTPSILNFNKFYTITGINYINGLLFWTDNYNPPRKINIDRCRNYNVDGFSETDINVIVKPPIASPVISFPTVADTLPNNLENKFLYFSYRYKYLDDEYSSLSPFSPVAFFPKPFAYDYGVSENVSMVNSKSAVDIKYNTGGANVKEIQLIFIDTLSTNAYVIDNINKQANNFTNNATKTFTFQNNKVYTVLPADQVNRLFDNVPLKAQAQDLIGSRLVYGNYTQFFNLVDSNGANINPAFSLSLEGSLISDNQPHSTFKSNRDYELGIVYLDDYGRSTTVIVPTENTNTLYIPADRANYANDIKITIDKDYAPPAFATYYRFVLKQNKQEYYNVFPLTYFSDGQFKWFLINQADVDKISVGSYLYLKNTTNGNLNTQFKVLDIVSKSANFLNNGKQQPSGVYFRVKIGSNVLPETYSYNYSNVTSLPGTVAIINRFNVVENPIFYGTGEDDLHTSNGNAVVTVGTHDVRFTIQIDSVGAITGDTYKLYAFYNGVNNLVDSNLSIVAGADLTLFYVIDGTYYDMAYVKFDSASGHTVGDYWTVMVRNGTKNIFGGYIVQGGSPYGFATGIDWNLNGAFVGDREIKAGAQLTFKMKEPNNGDTQSVQNFVSTRNYKNIEEWFIEDGVYSKWIQYQGELNIGPLEVCFRRTISFLNVAGTQYQANQGSTISSTTLNAPVFMWIYGYGIGDTPNMEVIFELNESLEPVLFETVPTDTNQDIYYELTNTYPIVNNSHYTNGTNQVLGTTNGIAYLKKQDSTTYPNYDFNAFAWSNGVESFRIRDDWNAATMQFSPRANSTVEGYAQQTLVQALTYSGVYQQTTAINRLNEFNLSLGNFKYLDRFFGSIQKLHARDTDLVVFQENKISKVLYGKNLISDSVGGGTIASIPEVLGTQISYIGEYGISDNPESFAIWGNNLYFTDARRGAALQLTEAGLFEVSSNGMKNWFKANLDPSTQKIGMFDPYFEHYVLVNNEKLVKSCNLSVSSNDVVISYVANINQFAFAVESNSQWSITVPGNDWLAINTKYGNGNGQVNVTTTATEEARSITVVVSGCDTTINVIIRQSAAPPIYPTTWYSLKKCSDNTNHWSIGYESPIFFAPNVRVTSGSSTYVVLGGYSEDPGGVQLPITSTGQLYCPDPTTTTTTSTTTTTTAAPTTSTTTTTTTTTAAPYDYYLATQYICGDCGTPVSTNLLVKFAAGTTVIPSRFYKELSANNYTYEITDTGQSPGSAYELTTPSYLSCAASCPATTTSTTTSTTTIQYIWYELTNCNNGNISYSISYPAGTFGVNDRVIVGISTTVKITAVLTTDPGGSQFSITPTGLTGCPGETTTTTTSTTTAAPTTTSTTTTSTTTTTTTTIQTVWYEAARCSNGAIVYSIAYTVGAFGINDRITISGINYVITNVLTYDPGTSLQTFTYTGSTGCPTITTTTTSTTTTTTAAPTTTTTTTTTAAPTTSTTTTTTAAPTTTTTTTTIAPTTSTTTTTTTAAPNCHLYTFSDDAGTGGYVYYVPCGRVIETMVYVPEFTAPQYCVADGYTPFSPDGISILGPFSACS